MSIPQIEDKLNVAYKEYKEAKKKAERWRNEFMEDLAEARSLAKDTDKDKELKQLRTIEKQRTQARNIKRMHGKLQRNATTKIYITDNNGRQVVTDKDGMVEAVIDENDARFSQSEDTPDDGTLNL